MHCKTTIFPSDSVGATQPVCLCYSHVPVDSVFTFIIFRYYFCTVFLCPICPPCHGLSNPSNRTPFAVAFQIRSITTASSGNRIVFKVTFPNNELLLYLVRSAMHHITATLNKYVCLTQGRSEYETNEKKEREKKTASLNLNP